MGLTIISALSLAAWLYLTFLRGQFWRASERLAPIPGATNFPPVAVIIPARDEAETIAAVVTAHCQSTYPGEIFVTLVDDHSSDATAEIATAAYEKVISSKRDANRKFQCLKARPLPRNWSGKLWAVQQGIDHVQKHYSHAKYILFTDADIEFGANTIQTLVSKAEQGQLALVSLMVRLDSREWGSLLIPAFIYFFQKLYPFPLVNNSNIDIAAAAGGCMLITAQAIKKIDGVTRFKNNLIDDCALAREIKMTSPTTKIWLGLADREALSLRDNRSFASNWNMVARTAYTQLNYSPLFLVGTVAGMFFLYWAAPIIALTALFQSNFIAALLSISTIALMACTYWPTLNLYNRKPWEALLLPLAAMFYTLMTLASALRTWRGKGGQWKGRTYSSSQ
ncbi:MAG: hypothetical protein DHS20C05_03210 [Hyphococcus sp.]|nr:MAG: hypothetical protein DHS20C05_03210 [Marinicaulis sp.]